MKKIYIIIITALVAVFVSVMIILRLEYSGNGNMTTSDITVVGITDMIAGEAGGFIDGITVSVPEEASVDDIICVSSDTDIAYLEIDKKGGDGKIYPARIVLVAEGIAKLYIAAEDGTQITDIYTVNVIKGEASDTVTTERFEDIEDPVYVTTSGKRYHLKKSCAGKTSHAISLADAVTAGYTPCKTCAMTK